MKKKILSLTLCCICIVSLFTACGNSNEIELPITEYNENITKPQGKFLEIDGKPTAQGGLSAMGKDYIKLMVEGKEYEFKLSDDVIRKVGIFNKDKDNLMIKRGTVLMLTYEVQDETYFATDIEIINAN